MRGMYIKQPATCPPAKLDLKDNLAHFTEHQPFSDQVPDDYTIRLSRECVNRSGNMETAQFNLLPSSNVISIFSLVKIV